MGEVGRENTPANWSARLRDGSGGLVQVHGAVLLAAAGDGSQAREVVAVVAQVRQ